MSYKEQIFKELEVLKNNGGTLELSEYKPHVVKQYTFQFNQHNGSDLVCSIIDGIAVISRKQDSQSIQDHVDIEISKLKNIGDYCMLEGNTNTLRSCVCRISKSFGLDVMTRIIDGKLRVVVMGIANENRPRTKRTATCYTLPSK